MRLTVTTKSSDETMKLGERIGAVLRAKLPVAMGLFGDLGSGKTTFLRGVARGLGLTRRIQSPSFTIARALRQRGLVFAHFDLYRLDRVDPEVAELLKESLSDSRSLTVIEWAERAKPLLPAGAIRVGFSHHADDRRRIVLEGPAAIMTEVKK